MLQFKLDSVRVLWHCFHKIIHFFVWSTQESRRKRILWCSFSFVFFITFYFFDTIPLKLYRFSLSPLLSVSISHFVFSFSLGVSALSFESVFCLAQHVSSLFQSDFRKNFPIERRNFWDFWERQIRNFQLRYWVQKIRS